MIFTGGKEMELVREIFGQSRDEVWQQFSDEIRGKFTKGTLFTTSTVEARVENWPLLLGLYTFGGKIWFTKMTAPYINKDGFKFAIYEASFFRNIDKLFGMQDIEVGNPDLKNLKPLFGTQSYLDDKEIDADFSDFDEKYIICGNDEAKVKALFKNLEIRRLIQANPYIHFEIVDCDKSYKTNSYQDVDILSFQVLGVVKDLNQLKSIYDLFAETLNHLCHLGSAYKNDPSLSL